MAILNREFRPNGQPDTIELTMLNNYQVEPILPIPFPLEPRNCLRPSLSISGIIGVYVARIYNEVRARPAYMLSRIRKHVDTVEYDEGTK